MSIENYLDLKFLDDDDDVYDCPSKVILDYAESQVINRLGRFAEEADEADVLKEQRDTLAEIVDSIFRSPDNAQSIRDAWIEILLDA